MTHIEGHHAPASGMGFHQGWHSLKRAKAATLSELVRKPFDGRSDGTFGDTDL